ncbi:hypothetical protein DFJ73DRAFT_826935 [Zopfochytrium polystomum]|nr:hypothetical protein DFJ73DRAFT_826935 [Zopfochytrium polystomum]
MSSRAARLIKGLIASASIIAVGYGFMTYTVPSDREIAQRIGVSHQLSADERARAQALLDMIKANAESNRPAWVVESPHDSSKKPPPVP